MKTQKIKKCMSLFLAALMCVTTLFGIGTTAYAAEETDEVCLVSFPRDGDANYGGEWGHGSYTYANGWSMASSRYTTIRAMGSYDGNERTALFHYRDYARRLCRHCDNVPVSD